MIDPEKFDNEFYKPWVIMFFESEENFEKFLKDFYIVKYKYQKIDDLIKIWRADGGTGDYTFFTEWLSKKLDEGQKQIDKEWDERLEDDLFFQDILTDYRKGDLTKVKAKLRCQEKCEGDWNKYPPYPYPLIDQIRNEAMTRQHYYLIHIDEEPDPADIEKKEGGTDESILSAAQPRPEEDIFNKSYFYGFKIHLPILKKDEYIMETPTGLEWNDKKGGNLMLAAYFGMLQNRQIERSKNEWSIVERVFNTKHLSQSWSDLESVRKGKSNKWDKEYKYLKSLVKNLGSGSL